MDESGNLRLPSRADYYEDPSGGPLSIAELACEDSEDFQPTIYYLEDMDKVIGKNESDYAKITLSSFLTALDGVKRLADGIIIIATTNNKDSLESSIIGRPGRFERIYEFNKPGPLEIEKYLSLKNIVIGNKTITQEYVKQLERKNYSMAFVEEFVLSCTTQSDSNKISKAVADSVLADISTFNKTEVINEGIGFNT